MGKVPPLFEHQTGDIEFELDRDEVFDTSDPGTGKTRSRIEVYSRRLAKGAGAALVLAPKTLLKAAWENDARKFAPWLKISCAFAENREEAFEVKADMFVTNHDAVKWLAKQSPKFFARFTDLIVDESGAYKHHTSQRSKALNQIKKHFKHKAAMNGVPNPNTVTDVWNQVNVLDNGRRLGPSFFAFRSTVQVPKQVGPSPRMVKWEDRQGAEEAVAKLLADITISHRFEDCHDIPENHSYVVPFELNRKLRMAYDEMEASSVLRLDTGIVSAVNAAAVVTKLLQVASGAVYDENGDYHLIDGSRYEMIADLAQQRKHSVVFFLWRHQRDMLIEEFKRRGLTHTIIDGSVTRRKRDEAVEMYQQGFYRVLLAHPQSAAHGLTLTRGTSTIWSSPTYNLEHWLQGNRRIYRAGQTQKTETINVIASDTIEERVYHVLTTKNVKVVDLLKVLR